ncbi:type II toxin-antitoxin system Phd/YefM family antitoxin [Subtercola vilae]|uniref:type II toxin-antitoxin system Phd/YefM family antitoxin n=1 Tax=Subtercola vilae TaxID=2056433 RepID=UPI0010A9FFD1|nr:type II toxin-antitoxin system Phd/YefM family antitoxin [Subtercola vilae]
MFERHEPILITDHGKPFAVIQPVETHFPVTITLEQLARLRVLYGEALTPPELVASAVTTLIEASERDDLADYIQGKNALESFRETGEPAIGIADVDWPK